jgi:hypothetical protein
LSFRRNRTFVVAWLTPLLVALAALLLPAGAAAASVGNIAGTVTGEGHGALSGVEVCAIAVDEEGFECGTSGAGGAYEISGLAEGEYVVEFWPAGQNYVWEFYENTRKWAAATPVTVTAGVTKSGVDAELEKGATISGVVTAAATGHAAPEVVVCAFSTGEFSYGCAETSAVGSYTISGLTGGEYEVEFRPEGNGQGLLAQLYSLGLVTVSPHGEAKGVNQALQAGGQILGVVRLAATGAPLAGVRVCLSEAEFLEPLICLTTPASGGYGFIGLWSDRYKVVFSAGANEFPDPTPIVDSFPTQWWKGASSFVTASPIAITPPTVLNGIDAALGPPAAAPITPKPLTPTAPVTPVKKIVKKPLKCRKGFAKRKVRGKQKCVRLHKAAKHKRHHKKRG